MHGRSKTRREFFELGSAAFVAPLLSSAADAAMANTPSAMMLTAEGLQFTRMPRNFTGLSYETPQLYNPEFFSAKNQALVQVFRDLSAQGVLRVGGNLSDLARWKSEQGDFATEKQTAAIEHGRSYWEWKLTDTFVREHRDGAITPAAIRELRSFLDATGWDLIYGLSLGSGSTERAADEAACVFDVIGPRLLAFQIGNENDFFGGNRWFREKGYDIDLYLREYKQYVAAVRARTPKAQFGGPDVAANMSWVEQFAAKADKPLVLLSAHHYAMGPAKNPEMNAERLLNAKLDAGLTRQTAQARAAVVASGGVPFRMSEGNSCFGGGKSGVSDAFASALWVADYMLSTASDGYAGVNLHGGGDGYYTPIETLDDRTAIPRPMFYGMQFAERFAGWEVARANLSTDKNVTAYIGRQSGVHKMAVINKSADAADFLLSGEMAGLRKASVWLLRAPSLEAKAGVTFGQAKLADILRSGVRLSVPAFSASLIEFPQHSGARQ